MTIVGSRWLAIPRVDIRCFRKYGTAFVIAVTMRQNTPIRMYLIFHKSDPASLRPCVSRKLDTIRNPEAYIRPTSARNQYGIVRDRSVPVLGGVGTIISAITILLGSFFWTFSNASA